MSGETRQPQVATVLAWRAAGRAEPQDGPRRLELASSDPPSPADEGSPVGPAAIVPGSALDALLATSGVAIAADLQLGDVATGLAPEALESGRRMSVHLDAAWAAGLGLATEAPLLDLLLHGAAQALPTGPEAALGAALARALEDGIGPDGIDVSLLRDAAGPLEDLLATLPAWDDGLAPRLRLDTDVLQLARTAWRFLHVTHQAWFAARNRAGGGDPRHMLHHPVDVWARGLAGRAGAIVERVHVLRTLEGTGEDLGELVKQHFTWAASSDRDGFAAWLEGRVTTPIETVLALVDPGATELAVRLEAHLPELRHEDDVADAVDAVGRYLEAWLQTDAGLLARLHRELHLASDTGAWRRVDIAGACSEWSVADVPGAAHTTAVALDVVDLLAEVGAG